MNKYFLPYDLSVKLKEKGFNVPFYFYYRTDDESKSLHHANVTNPLVYSKVDNEVVIAPSFQQIFEWLRTEMNIDIDIESSVNIFGYKVYTPYISTYKEFSLDNSPEIIRYKQTKINPPLESFHFLKWEDAAIEAIKYVIDELI